MKEAPFAGIGTWRLSAYKAEVDGKTGFPLGAHATGQLVYDANGYMAAQIAGEHRTRLSTEDYRKLAMTETDAAFKSYVAYFGTYEVDAVNKKVIHHVQACLLPNWAGTDLIRCYEFEANRLILRTEPVSRGGHQIVLTLVWERLA
jgi:hypothetical protein